MRNARLRAAVRESRALLIATTLTFAASGATADPSRDNRVVNTMLALYIHGVTPEIASELISPADLPTLYTLLADSTFPRRDNVLAFLSHVSDHESTSAVLRLLQSPGDPAVPEEDRALLLAPQALGHFAARGDTAALSALLDMTGPDAAGGVLAAAAARARDPRAFRRDLLRMALRGLALSRTPAARARLQALAARRTRPPRDLDNAAVTAAEALELMEEIEGGGSGMSAAAAPRAADSQTRTHESGITYANHPDVPSPMDDARLDAVLELASLRAGRSDFAADVSCCVLLTRSGGAQSFGSAGDGLDIIDNAAELNAALGNPIARVKVVRAINYCGGPVTNVIGCANLPGDGIAVVRVTGIDYEAVLWIHEFGHNVGLGHVADNRYIMFGTNNGNNRALSQSECNTFHSPHVAANITPADVGACNDTDGDEVHDMIDNCPTVANFDQADADSDGTGDLCETQCGDGVMEGSEECDDGNLDPDDGCTASCTICSNGIVTPPEQCDDGALVGGDGCSASCVLDCPSTPAGGCTAPFVPGTALLTLKNRTPADGDLVVWRWLRGPATPKSNYGSPTTSTSYVFCLYDAAGLVLEANAPAAGVCKGKSCWVEAQTSFKYSDLELTPDGLRRIVLRGSSVDGKASIKIKGIGASLGVPDPTTLLSPIRAQLLRNGSTTCWEALYSAPFLMQTATDFKDRAD